MSYETDFDSAFTILLGKAIGAITLTGVPASTPTTPVTTTTSTPAKSAGIEFIIDGGGAVITTGSKGGIIIPFDSVLNKVELQEFDGIVGSINITIQRGTPSGVPTFTSIVGNVAPSITSGRHYADSALVNWNTNLPMGDALRFVVNTVATFQRITVMLYVRRTDVDA